MTNVELKHRISASVQGFLRPALAQQRFVLELNEADRPFFVVGSGRCGTTLLRRMLMGGGEVFMPPETYVLPNLVSLYRRTPKLHWREFVSLSVALFEHHEEFDRWNLPLRGTAHSLWQLPVPERSLARIVDEVFKEYGRCHAPGASRWGDKTPKYVFYLPAIQKLFPKARFVHLLRDGVDVVSSLLQMRRPGFGLVESANRWTSAVESFRRFEAANPSQCFELRYEQLVTEPEAALARVCAFLDLTYDTSMTNSTLVPADVGKVAHHANLKKRLDTNSIGKGRQALPPADRDELQRLIGPMLQSLGYPPAA